VTMTSKRKKKQKMTRDRVLRLYYGDNAEWKNYIPWDERNRIIDLLIQKGEQPLSLPVSEIQRLRTELEVHDKMQHIVQGTFQLSEQQEQERANGGASAFMESQQPYDHSVFLHSDILFHLMLYVDAIELLMTIQFVSKPFYNAVRNLLDWDTLSYDQVKLKSTGSNDQLITMSAREKGENDHNENSAIMLDSSMTLQYEQYVSLKKQARNYWTASCLRFGVLHGGVNPRESFMKAFKLRKTEQEKVLRCSRCQHWFSLDDIESRKRDICEKYTMDELGHDFSDAIQKIDMKHRAQKFNAQLGGLEPPPPPPFGLISPEPNKLASESQWPSSQSPQLKPVYQPRNRQGEVSYAQQVLTELLNRPR